MRLVFFELTKLGTGISGGETCLIEVAKYLRGKEIQTVIVTTDNGKNAYEDLGLTESNLVEYVVIPSYAVEKRLGRFISYLARTLKALGALRQVRFKDSDVLVCNNDFFPNSIPFYAVALRNPKCKLVYWYRTPLPSILRGFMGEYTRTFHIPSPALVYWKITRKLYEMLTLGRGVIITYMPSFGRTLKKRFPSNQVYVLTRYGGSPFKSEQFPGSDKKYDLLWIGRFQRLKGLSDVPILVSRLKARKKDINLALLGGGNDSLLADFKRRVNSVDVEDNITYKGFVTGAEKYSIMTECRILVMTSYYESFGNVIVEAMGAGLPVVTYDLPAFEMFEDKIYKVPVGDVDEMARMVERLLNDSKAYAESATTAWEYSKTFSWEAVAEELLGVSRLV